MLGKADSNVKNMARRSYDFYEDEPHVAHNYVILKRFIFSFGIYVCLYVCIYE